MKVSVIIPCFNEHNTVENLLNNVNQENSYDKEIIVIDDFSTDGTREILQKLNSKYTKLKLTTSSENAIELLTKSKTTEGYIVSEENKYIGKISLLNLINKKSSSLINLVEKKPLIIDPNSNLIFVIKKLSKFVGESIPIVNKKTNEMIGIISENDVLQAYLDISEEINQIEKH